MPNKLESLIIEGTKRAFKFYESASGGHLLHHAPEHLIEVIVAQVLFESNNYHLYLDASVKKVLDDLHHDSSPDAVSEISSLRPDLTIWRKQGTVAGILEIKRAWSAAPLIADRNKLLKIRSSELIDCSFYLLAYTAAQINQRTSDPAKLIKGRFKDWETKTGWHCVSNFISPIDKDEITWGGCLLRAP